MKKKIILSAAFIISLLPMLMNQYGGLKGVQEITGLINLFNPIGIIAVILFVLGVWMTFEKQIIGRILGILGTVGIVVSEIYQFFTCFLNVGFIFLHGKHFRNKLDTKIFR